MILKSNAENVMSRKYNFIKLCQKGNARKVTPDKVMLVS